MRRPMLSLAMCFTVLLSAFTLARAADGPRGGRALPAAEGIAISVDAADHGVLHVGDPVRLVLRIKNTGTEPVTTSALEDFPTWSTCLLFDARGKAITATGPYPPDKRYTGMIVTLQPNEERQFTIELNKIYNLDHAGSYVFLWMRQESLMQFFAVSSAGILPPVHYEAAKQIVVVTSNLLTFTLIEKE